MKQELLFHDEHIITESKNHAVTLTNKRVRYLSSSSGNAHIVSIMLEKVSSIEVHYKSYIIMLYIFILSAIGAVLSFGVISDPDFSNPEVNRTFLVIAIVSLLIYLFSRRHIVTIASDGGAAINFKASGMKSESIIDFINKVEKAKGELHN